VQLHEDVRQRARVAAAPAADAADLLAAEGNGRQRSRLRPDALERLDRRDDPERPVEAPALGHRVEV
jgi:hypothetical protein